MTGRFVAIGFALSSLGCDAVTSTAPVGSKAAPIDAAEWDGAWVGEDGEPILFRVLDSSKGVLRMSAIEDGRWKHSYLYLRTVPGHENRIFASMRDDPDAEPPAYVWGRVKRQGEYLLFWAPDLTGFRSLVEEGVLPGEIEDDRDVRLGELGDEHLTLIAEEAEGALFAWDAPMILRRSEGLTLCRTPYTMAGCETRPD